MSTPADDATEGNGRTRAARARPRRAPILVVVVVVAVAAIVAQHRAPDHAAAAAPVPSGASLAPAGSGSSTWYCTEGTSSADGRADETLLVANLDTTSIDADVTVMLGDRAPVTRAYTVAAGAQRSIKVSDLVASPEPGVVVEIDGGRAAVAHQLVHGSDVAVEPCTRTAGTDWYFAAGTTAKGSAQTLALFNPFGDDAIVDVTLLTSGGQQQPDQLQGVVVPRRSRVSLNVNDAIGRQDLVAADVHARTGRVVAERSQIFDGTAPDSGPTRRGIAVSLGAPTAATSWHVAAGTTRSGGATSLAVANFGDHAARAQVAVVLVGVRTLAAQAVDVPAGAVTQVDLGPRVPQDSDFAVTVTSTATSGTPAPLVVETLTTWPPSSTVAAVASIVGQQTTARRWVVIPPDLAGDVLVTVYNPGTAPASAAVLPAASVDRRSGVSSEPEVALAAGAAKVVAVVRAAGGPTPMVVTADHPVVVGLTVVGSAGASLSAGLPDPAYPGS